MFGVNNSGNMFSGSSNTRSIYPSQNMFGNNQQLSGNNPYQNWMGNEQKLSNQMGMQPLPKLTLGGGQMMQPMPQNPGMMQGPNIGPSFDFGELLKRIMMSSNPGGIQFAPHGMPQ